MYKLNAPRPTADKVVQLLHREVRRKPDPSRAATPIWTCPYNTIVDVILRKEALHKRTADVKLAVKRKAYDSQSLPERELLLKRQKKLAERAVELDEFGPNFQVPDRTK